MNHDLAIPDFLRVDAAEQTRRDASWKGRRLRWTRDMQFDGPAKQEDPATKALRKELAKAEEQKKAERFARLKELNTNRRAKPASQETTMEKTSTKKKTTKSGQVAALRTSRAARKGPGTKKARGAGTARKAAAPKADKAAAKPQRAPSSAPAGDKVIRPGSKLEIIVGLLKRPEGCTTAQVLAATEWPAVSMPQQAKAAGLELVKEKKDGVTVYRAA